MNDLVRRVLHAPSLYPTAECWSVATLLLVALSNGAIKLDTAIVALSACAVLIVGTRIVREVRAVHGEVTVIKTAIVVEPPVAEPDDA